MLIAATDLPKRAYFGSRLSGLSPSEVNDAVTIPQKSGLVEWRRHLGTHPFRFGQVNVTPRGRYESERTKTRADSGIKSKVETSWDLFICHASEDKDSVARPLAVILRDRGSKVWYDEFELLLGDSLRRKIDFGLANSRYGIVILSKDFFRKDWPQKELDALVARDDGKEKVILPIWHGVSKEDIVKYSPLLADRMAISTSRGLDKVVDEVLKAVSRNSSKEKTPSTTPQPSDRAYAIIGLKGAFRSLRPDRAAYAPKIAPEHLLKRTRGQTIASTAVSLLLVFLSTSTPTTEQLNIHWQLFAIMGSIVGLISVFRNSICDWVYARASFALHYKIRSFLQTSLSMVFGLTMGTIVSGLNRIPRSVFGPIFSIALTVSAIICAIGTVISARNEASLKLAQSLYEANRDNMKEAFKWFDSGLYMIIRMLRELGYKHDAPQLRLGGREYYGKCGKNAEIIRDLSQAVLNIDDREQLQRVEDLTIQLNEHAEDAISRGIKPQPIFADYLDRRHLTLDNIYKIVLILAALFGIAWTIRTGMFPPR